jgi:drug/metabolite transporter (DMT)-like permease
VFLLPPRQPPSRLPRSAMSTSLPRERSSFGAIDLWLLTVVATWAINFKAAQMAGRLATGGRLDPRSLILLRMIFVVPVLIPLAGALGKRTVREMFALSRRELVLFAALSFAAIPCNQFFFIWGMQHTSTIHGALLFATSPVIAALLAAFWGNERPTRRVWTSMAIAFAGVALVVSRSAMAPSGARTDAEPALFGDVLILASATGWGFYASGSTAVLATRNALEVTMLTMTFGLAWTALLGGAPLAREVSSGAFVHQTSAGWAGLLYVSYMGALYGWVVWTVGLARIGPSRTMLYQYLVPLLSMVLGLAFFGERAEWRAIGGAALILLGVAWGRRG